MKDFQRYFEFRFHVPKAKSSMKTSSSMNLCTPTKWSRRRATCAGGPPKATKPKYQKSERVSLMRVERGLVSLLVSLFAPADPYPSSEAVRGSFSDAIMDTILYFLG